MEDDRRVFETIGPPFGSLYDYGKKLEICDEPDRYRRFLEVFFNKAPVIDNIIVGSKDS